jgi:hypothetical protein
MPKCEIHPGRDGVLTINSHNYCSVCRDGIQAARVRVDRHVEPKDCFVWFEGGARGWQPIPGTGCAHWLAHQRNFRSARASNACLEGFPIRVASVIEGKTQVNALANVRVDDIYVTPSRDHTGLVFKIEPGARPTDPPRIFIRHDSSAQGGVHENEFATYFNGQGNFFR